MTLPGHHTPLLSGVAVAFVALAPPAGAQLTRVESFSQIPGGVFHNIVNPSACSVHFRENIPIEVGGRTITWSYFSEVRSDHRYPMGCINYSSSSWNTWRVNPDQTSDPGDFIGDYMVPEDGNGDVIINFSEPLTAFGSTSILGPFANSSRPNNKDTFVVYDGPDGTGNALATVTTADIVHLQLRLDFAGVVSPVPIIRSVRYINEFPSLTIDGIAIAAGCPADYNGDGFVDGIDYDDFNNDFEAGNPQADYNGDGFVDGIDYDDFNNDFAAGC